ncbi:hypothetical protein F4604DRAFT_1918001 [Suillus subluteus]|nr:hypothetical protein F4604DRAFT_1918001 [Suillus subluteus]
MPPFDDDPTYDEDAPLEDDTNDSFLKTHTKDITLEGEDDFTEMVGQVQVKKNAEGTLVLIENKIDNDESDDETVGSPTHTQKKCTDVPDSDDDDTWQPNGQKKAKKQSQIREPTAEEEEQDRIIKDLQDPYHCKDKACPYNICWPAGTSVNNHIHLTFQHLHFWASAIVVDFIMLSHSY